MQKVLVIVDMQNDFVDGALGTAEARAIVPAVTELVRSWDGPVLFTRDTHGEDYLATQEGRNLPVPHCIEGTDGWQLIPALQPLAQGRPVIDKPTFGSVRLADLLTRMHADDPLESVTFAGVCTGICVISNAMLIKAALPEAELIVDSALCAGTTPANHEAALTTMKSCQIQVK